MVSGIMKQNKNGVQEIKYSCDYDDHYTEASGWTCNECGEFVGDDEGVMQDHMNEEHNASIRYQSKEWCDKYE